MRANSGRERRRWVTRGCVCAEGEAECGEAEAEGEGAAADAEGGREDSPPPLPAFGYAHPHPSDLSPSHSRSYQELRPAAAGPAPHARDMQAYAHLEDALFKPAPAPAAGPPGCTDGAYLRGRSPDLSPSPERRDDYRLHYEYAPPPPPPYSHDHHHHADQ